MDLKYLLVPAWSPLLAALSAGLAAMLAGHLALSRERPGRGAALAFLLAFALQSGLLVVQLLRPELLPAGLRAITGATLPGLLYLFVGRGGPPGWRGRDAAHALPVLAVAVLASRPAAGWALDAALLLIELGYALALLSGDRRGPDGLRRRARHAAAGFLLVMAVCDLWIGWELAQGSRLDASPSVAVATGLLIASGLALFVAAWRDPEWWVRLRDGVRDGLRDSGLAPAPLAGEAAPAAPADDADHALCARLEALFQDQRVHTEFGIGLDELAQRLGVAPRQLSAAVNRVHQRGFRTLLNDRRVAQAAGQLRDPALTGKAITALMFDAGFQTKSSFNKEFAARHACSPSQYREQGASAGSA